MIGFTTGGCSAFGDTIVELILDEGGISSSRTVTIRLESFLGTSMAGAAGDTDRVELEEVIDKVDVGDVIETVDDDGEHSTLNTIIAFSTTSRSASMLSSSSAPALNTSLKSSSSAVVE